MTLSATLVRLIALTAAVSWHGGAHAACPSHDRVNTILRFAYAKLPLRGLPTDLSMKDAECGRWRLVERLESLENRIVGYKAGLTNLIVVVKDAAIHEARTHLEVLKSLSLVVPFIELPDILVAEGQPLSGSLITMLNVGARLGVVGKGIPVQPTAEFAGALANMQVVTLDETGKELARGPGTAILGHPLNAVIWLAEDLRQSRIRLKSGDMLSLGAFSAPLKPRPGLAITVRYLGLPGDPSVGMRFR